MDYKVIGAPDTLQTCPACQAIAKKVLSWQGHKCECGYSMHRDHAVRKLFSLMPCWPGCGQKVLVLANMALEPSAVAGGESLVRHMLKHLVRL